MPFEKHAFISYAHIDDQKLEGQPYGWVTRFHNTLKAQLEMRLGGSVDIWRDDKLAGNDKFSDEIVGQLPQVMFFIPVLSPRYLDSPWCQKEAAAFCRVASASIGVRSGNKSRIFKVLKLPVKSLDRLPEDFRDSLGFPFYKSQDNVPVELDPAYGAEMTGPFNLSVAMLAQKIVDTMEVMKDSGAGAGEQPLTVYLAESGWDRDSERKQLEADLRSHGYAVLPDGSLPSREKECRQEIARLLEQCHLSVHLIGSDPGMTPSGRGEELLSVDQIQNDLAAQQSASRKLRRIIWAPDGLRATDADHRRFIESLHRSEQAQFGADLITGDFAALKGAVLAALRKAQEADPAADDGAPENLIYVECDRRDSRDTVELRKWLRGRDFDPQRSLFEGAAATVRQQNERLAAQCKGAVIFYGAGDEEWYQSVARELEKVNRRAPVWTLVSGPETGHKQELIDEFEGGPVMNGLRGLPEDDLERFVQALKGKAQGR